MGWLQAIAAFFGFGAKVADIIKTGQENARRDHDEKQGEQNANAAATSETLNAVIGADRASSDPDVIERVRAKYERP